MSHPGAPGEPEFEDIVSAAALDRLVARVIRRVVEFVGRKQITRPYPVALLQKSL